MALADLVAEIQLPSTEIYDNASLISIRKSIVGLQAKASNSLIQQGVPISRIQYEVYLNMRYYGTDTALMILQPDDGDFKTAFLTAHKREFTFLLKERDILVDDIRVRATGNGGMDIEDGSLSPFAELEKTRLSLIELDTRDQIESTSVYMDGYGKVTTPVFQLSKLKAGSSIKVCLLPPPESQFWIRQMKSSYQFVKTAFY